MALVFLSVATTGSAFGAEGESSVDAGSSIHETTATFTFSSDDPEATFECALDGARWRDCASPIEYHDLSIGEHIFEVRAIDLAGNMDPTPASRTWTILESTPPETTIDSGPDGAISATSVAFAFSASESGGTFDCRIDEGAFEPCESPTELTGLSEGEHAFGVRATDAAGNTDESPDVRRWTIDTVGPTVSIDDAPDGLVASAAAIVSFSSEPDATFECRVDGAEFAPCASPVDLAGLADGERAFRVRATDAAGNTGAPADAVWTVDTTAPVVGISAGPEQPRSTETRAEFQFAVDEAASIECRLDTDDFAPCTSPWEHSGLADGDHTFRVRATDEAGNPGVVVSWSWTIAESVDIVGPTVTIDRGPDGTVGRAQATFEFGSEPDATFECRLDDAAFAPCGSPQELADLADGEHAFRVRATDAAGNTGEAEARTWTIDSVAPTVTIVQKPDRHTQARRAEVHFDADEPVELFECKLGGDETIAFAPCTSPHRFTDLADGAYVVRVRATDRAGNRGEADVWEWTVDTTAPTARITQRPEATATGRDAELRFESDEPGAFECRSDGSDWQACESPHQLSDLELGEHTFRVGAIDRAGNAGEPDVATWTIVEPPTDDVPPTVTIGQRPERHTQARRAEFTFEADEPVDRYECRLGGDETIAFAPCTSPHVLTDLVDGDYVFRVRAVDTAGNQGTADVAEWSVDNAAPVTKIGQRPDGTTSQRRAEFTFDADEPVRSFECRRDEQDGWHACESPREYVDLAIGSHVFRVRAIDRAGNVGEPDKADWTIIESPPVCVAGTSTVEAEADSWVLQSSRDSNHGKDGDAKVITKSKGNGRVVVRFPLPDIPEGCEVTDARLVLFATSWKTGRTLEAIRLASGWNEHEITWRNQPDTVGDAASAASGPDKVVWDVTAQTRRQYADGNHGFLVRDASENGRGAEQVFHTRDKGSQPPRLVISFDLPS